MNENFEKKLTMLGFFGSMLKRSGHVGNISLTLCVRIAEFLFYQFPTKSRTRIKFSAVKFRIIFVAIFAFSIQKMPRLLVASQDGYLYIYNLDPSEGGECTLLKQHR